MAELQLPKLIARVRFPSSPPTKSDGVTGKLPRGSRAHIAAVPHIATMMVLLGCVVAAAHLVLGGTSSLALAAVNLLEGWPYFFGSGLIVIGLLIHVAQPATSAQHVVITVSAGVVEALALPIAGIYFGFAGIGLESDEEVAGLMAAFVASVLPLIMAFAGGVFSWRTLARSTRYRIRGMVTIIVTSAALGAACIIFARLSFPGRPLTPS